MELPIPGQFALPEVLHENTGKAKIIRLHRHNQIREEDMYAEPIQNDPFICAMLAKMPSELRTSFSDTQLLGLKQALDTQYRSAHALDLRRTFSFWRWNFYFVFLFGQERRELSRRAQKIERMAILTATFLFVTVSTLFGLLFLYLVKSAMGIDLFPNFSLGIWDWFKARYL